MFSVFALILVGLVSEGFAEKLVVLSFDGFNPNYMSAEHTPFLFSLRSKSVVALHLTTIFPSKTFVTHFSVATGVRTDIHGVYGDRMFDADGNIMHNHENQFKTNADIIPIWTENQKIDGRHSAIMMWPGSEYSYNDVTPTYSKAFNEATSWNDRNNEILGWLKTEEKTPNLVMAFYENKLCNDKNEQEEFLNKHLQNIDNAIKQIYSELKTDIENGKANLIIMSGNGTETISYDKIIEISTIVKNIAEIKESDIIVSGPIVYIKTMPDNFTSVLQELENGEDNETTYNVYSRTTISSDTKMNTQNLDNVIILVAKSGYTFAEDNVLKNLTETIGKDNLILQENGYDSESVGMRGFFMATGPKFKENMTTTYSFNIIDVYPLFKHLLNLLDRASSNQDNTLKNSVNKILADVDISNSGVQLFTSNT